MRYLAIDYGLKRTGLAICDFNETICSPLAVIHGSKNLIKEILQIIETQQAEAIVLGLPLNMDDTEGKQTQLVYNFAEKLKSRLDIPIHFQDERLSTFSANEKLTLAEVKKSKKKELLDAVAAAEILESFLEAKNKCDL